MKKRSAGPNAIQVGAVSAGELPQNSPRQSPRMVTRIAAAATVVLLISLFLSRAFAQRYDFAIANLLTLILGFATWISLVLGLVSSRLPRSLWRSVALAPLVAIAVTLAMYRVTGFDGEIVPQLQWRWLRTNAPPEPASNDRAAQIDASKIEPRPTDFPQFLGANRNATVDHVKLEIDWQAHPPSILWKQPIGAGWSGFAVQGDLAVTMEQRDSEQWISAYDVESGTLLWHTAIAGKHFNPLGGAGPRSTPAIAGNRVFVHMNSGQVACLELANGEMVWEIDLFKLAQWDQAAAETKVTWGRSGSPLVVNDMVFVPFGGPNSNVGSLIALNIVDGNPVWRSGSDQISYSSPVRATLLGVDQILMVNESTITGHEIKSGRVLWTVPWAGKSSGAANVSQPIALDDARLFISKGYSQGCEVVKFERDGEGTWSFKIVWAQTSAMKTKFTNPVIRDENAYGLSDGILECIHTNSGVQHWKRGRYRQGQLLLVDDILLITAENGSIVLVAADPSGHKELAKFQVIGDVSWNTPALSGDRLLIRNAEEAACVRLPLKR